MNGIGALLGSASGSARDGVLFRHRRQPRIGVLRRDARQRQHADKMHHAAQQHARDDGESPAGSWAAHRRDRWHRRIALGCASPRRPACRRAAASARSARCRRSAASCRRATRAATRISNAAVGAADDFLAGEAVALQRIGDQMALAVGTGSASRTAPPASRRRRPTSQRPSSGFFLSSERGRERDAVAGADRQFAAAGDRGARIGIDVGTCRSWAARSRRRSSACRVRCRASTSGRSSRGRRPWQAPAPTR